MANDDRNTEGMKNQAEGKGEELKGRARQTAGGATGDTSQQVKGKGEELKGKAKQKFGEAQQDSADENPDR
jgi:uncharacterized protein YjbJ (UPF0337 family)